MEGKVEEMGTVANRLLLLDTVRDIISITHNRAEEMDHGVLCSTLAWGSRRGFLRAWREGTSERSLVRKGEKERKERYDRPAC